MKLALTFGIGSLLTLATSTVTNRPAGETGSAFRAEIIGEVSARPSGTARFGMAGGTDGAPTVFTISLGADGTEGSVLFTRRSGAPLVPGSYAISNREDGSDDLRALVMTGSATRPTGVFQGHGGTLVVTYASEREVRGTFRIDAEGFVAARPELEHRPIKVSGSFTASR